MGFDARQEAIEIVGETEFYEFSFGSGVERYTTNRRKTAAFGHDWTPLPISRESVSSDQTLDPSKTKIILPVRKPFVALIAQAGLDAIQVTIARGFGRNYAVDYRNPWWVGYLVDINVTHTVVEGNLESTQTLFEDPWPRTLHQPGCNQTLYDSRPLGCGVDPAAYLETRTVAAIADRGRTVSLNGTIRPNDWFTFGRMNLVGGAPPRHVLQQAGNDFVLHVPIQGLKAGDSVEVLPGCLKRVTEDCVGKFGNKPRFVGMPLTPQENPVIDGF